jgi:uncharacterized membrane protein (GlpM family)
MLPWTAAEVMVPFDLVAIAAKIVWSAGLVLGLSFLAERVSTRIAGIVAGAPQNTVLVYFFVGLDMGVEHVVSSTPHGIASFSATIAFVLAYYFASRSCVRWPAASGALAGTAVFFAIAAALAQVHFTLPEATALTLTVVVAAHGIFRHITLVPVAKPVRYTPGLLALRGGIAAVFIVASITAAEALGTRWTGLLTGFPAILLPTLLIINLTYGTAAAHAVMRNIPLGVVSILLYILTVPITFPKLGVPGGTAASLAVSVVYLGAIALRGGGRRRGTELGE